jgi:two-component system alkaline phosphatase synthesis response regulator PhoP
MVEGNLTDTACCKNTQATGRNEDLRILVIEDDSAIRRGLVDALEFAGYETMQAADGSNGLNMAVKVDCDLILLDLVLPERDGLDILKEVRTVRPTLPVIILTARGEEQDRVRGLRLGADDYVVKPFSVVELLARIEAVIRRSPERPADVHIIPFPGGKADLRRCEIALDSGEKFEISEREADVLRYLAINAGRVISRDELLANVWRISPKGVFETRTVDMHIARLREKLKDDPSNAHVIRTVRGKGYLFAGDSD